MLRSALLVAVITAMSTTGAFAQAVPASPRHHAAMRSGVIAANGRCNGVSYGTGARRCGTATGGPSGGLSSRN